MTNTITVNNGGYSAMGTLNVGPYKLVHEILIDNEGRIQFVVDQGEYNDVLEPTISNTNGYQSVLLPLADGTKKRLYVHQIVLWAGTGILTDRSNGQAVHHINGIKNDNRLVNLKMVTRAENTRHYVHQETLEQSNVAYDEEKIAEGRVSLRIGHEIYPDYAINIEGVVFKLHRGEWIELKRYVANKAYKSNVTVNVHGKAYSVGQLMAQNFMKVDKNKRYKVYQRDMDPEFGQNFYIRNLYTIKIGRK